MQYWLMKSEPDAYSIDTLQDEKKTMWDGVRNYQARNFMRDMKVGDKVLFYHSNAGKETGVVGEAKVSKRVQPDPSQFDKKSDYYDEKSSKDSPRWECVEVCFVKKYRHPVYLSDLKNDASFATMKVVQKGNRLSITPVCERHFKAVQKAASN